MSLVDGSHGGVVVFSVLLSFSASLWTWGIGAVEHQSYHASRARRDLEVERVREMRLLAEDCRTQAATLEASVAAMVEPPFIASSARHEDMSRANPVLVHQALENIEPAAPVEVEPVPEAHEVERDSAPRALFDLDVLSDDLPD